MNKQLHGSRQSSATNKNTGNGFYTSRNTSLKDTARYGEVISFSDRKAQKRIASAKSAAIRNAQTNIDW